MDIKEKQIQVVLTHELVDYDINEAVGNWTQHHFEDPDPVVKNVLLKYARDVAQKVLDGSTPFPNFETDWRERVSNAVHSLLDYDNFKKQQVPKIVEALQAHLGDLTEELTNGLYGYSLAKIANITGCVAYMIANQLDPDLLCLSEEEANQELLKMAQSFAQKNPNKVMVVDPETDDPIDIAIEVQRRIEQEEEQKEE